MKVVGVIPARYKSTRFPGKPLGDIAGLPMVARVYAAAKRSKLLSEVYVATEDQRIVEVCARLGIPAIMTADTHATGTDRVGEVAERVPADIYVNIQGDEPLILANTIDAAIVPLVQKTTEPQATNLCAEISDAAELLNTNVIKVVRGVNQNALYLSRNAIPYPREGRQLKYYKQVCVYGFVRNALLRFCSWPQGALERVEGIELLRFLENGCPVFMPEVMPGSISVDTPEDLRQVNELVLAGQGNPDW